MYYNMLPNAYFDPGRTPAPTTRGVLATEIRDLLGQHHKRARELQKSELAPPPPESPPPKWTSGLSVCGLGVIMFGDTTPNAKTPAFIQDLSFPGETPGGRAVANFGWPSGEPAPDEERDNRSTMRPGASGPRYAAASRDKAYW